MLEKLQSRHVIQLVGQCEDVILTEYHPTGTLGDLIESENYEQFNLIDRIKLALRYVEIVSYLHDSPGKIEFGSMKNATKHKGATVGFCKG